MVGAHVVRKTLLISVSWHDRHLDRDYNGILVFTLSLTAVYLVSQVFWRLTIFAAALFILIIMVQLILRIISIPDLALAILSMIMQSRVH